MKSLEIIDFIDPRYRDIPARLQIRKRNFKATFGEYFWFQTKKNYYNNFIKPMKLVRELRLFILQDVFHTNRQKHSLIESITKEQVALNLLFTKAFVL